MSTNPAHVVPYSADPRDMQLSLKVECPVCGIEWGWGADSAAHLTFVEQAATKHNQTCHAATPPAS